MSSAYETADPKSPTRPRVTEPVTLAELAGEFGLEVRGEARVTGVTLSSQRVLPGDLYAALPGSRAHGASYAASAVEAGAVAVLTDAAGAAELEAQGFGVPTTGTSAHAFTLLHDTEEQAFQAQVASLGKGTTLLVDTYDIAEAVAKAVEIAGPELGAVRIDSGDLGLLAHDVRRQLDDLGATDTKIIVTSDLDEYAIAGLAAAPVDGYGVGTQLVTGSGHPTAGFVYKLVAREGSSGELEPVAKKSASKASIGGRKYALRRRNRKDVADAEVIGIGTPPDGDANDRPLLTQLVKNGEVVGREPLDAARERHRASVAELPVIAHSLLKGDPAIPTLFP